jgi:hypothetical protein
MLVIKVFNGRRRDVNAVEIHLEGKEEKEKEKEKDEGGEGSMRARVTFLG